MNKQTKRIIMKNITKVGLSALAGSLVMVSANAVDYSISGDYKLCIVLKTAQQVLRQLTVRV